MNKELSVKHQKIAGVYNRNELIKVVYRPGLGGALARKYGISRQRVHQIISRNEHPKKRRWWKSLMFWR